MREEERLIIYGYFTDKTFWDYLGFADKTFWNYLELLIVPAALLIGGYLLNRAQREREREVEQAHRGRELEVENQRAQDAALEAYIDQMGQMLLDQDRPLREANERDEARTLARARTLLVLTRVDGERKGSVLQFLYESGLIARDHAVFALRGANLSGANLQREMLQGADLRRVNLQGADLRGVNLQGTALVASDLRGADLSESSVYVRSFRFANYVLPVGLASPANLSGADLRGVQLEEADLSGANLVNATVDVEDLAGSAILKGATMPNGQKYEDWLKDKEGSGNDVENE